MSAPPRLGEGNRWQGDGAGGWCFIAEDPTCPPGRQEGSGQAALPSVSVKGEQPLFPKMTFDFAPEPARTGADLCAGFWGCLKAAGRGHPPAPTQFSLCIILVSASSPVCSCPARVTRPQCPGPSPTLDLSVCAEGRPGLWLPGSSRGPSQCGLCSPLKGRGHHPGGLRACGGRRVTPQRVFGQPCTGRRRAARARGQVAEGWAAFWSFLGRESPLLAALP